MPRCFCVSVRTLSTHTTLTSETNCTRTWNALCVHTEWWCDEAGQNLHSSNTNFDLQNSLNANANRGIYFISWNVLHWFRTSNDCNNTCYFLKSIKSVFILVQCNISLSKKLCCTFNNCSWCDSLIWEKKQVCLCSLAICAYKIRRRRRIFPRIRI